MSIDCSCPTFCNTIPEQDCCSCPARDSAKPLQAGAQSIVWQTVFRFPNGRMQTGPRHRRTPEWFLTMAWSCFQFQNNPNDANKLALDGWIRFEQSNHDLLK